MVVLSMHVWYHRWRCVNMRDRSHRGQRDRGPPTGEPRTVRLAVGALGTRRLGRIASAARDDAEDTGEDQADDPAAVIPTPARGYSPSLALGQRAERPILRRQTGMISAGPRHDLNTTSVPGATAIGTMTHQASHRSGAPMRTVVVASARPG